MNKSHKGQVLFPTLLVIPMLLLFVFLLFETTKLSREKIRHQFALDSAAFIQMGDYTNLFNRTAYVNGVFPYRIFKELFASTIIKSADTNYQDDVSVYDLLYDSGSFPRREGDISGKLSDGDMDDHAQWRIRFFHNKDERTYSNRLVRWVWDAAARGTRMNYANPENEPTLQGARLVVIVGTTTAAGYLGSPDWQVNMLYINYYDAAKIVKLYVTVYRLLGDIVNSQIDVFEKLTHNFSFFRKSYYLNAGCSQESTCAEDGTNFLQQLRLKVDSGIKKHFLKSLRFFGKLPRGDPKCPANPINPFLPPCIVYGDFDDQLGREGLFQLATIDENFLQKIGNGVDVYQGWGKGVIENNFFNVNFSLNSSISRGCQGTEPGLPCVHVKVASQGPCFWKSGNNCRDQDGKSYDMNNSVWPYPTPKYQTRLYP